VLMRLRALLISVNRIVETSFILFSIFPPAAACFNFQDVMLSGRAAQSPVSSGLSMTTVAMVSSASGALGGNGGLVTMTALSNGGGVVGGAGGGVAGGTGGGGSSAMMDNSLWGLSSLGAIPDLLDCHRGVDHHQHQQQQPNVSSKLYVDISALL